MIIYLLVELGCGQTTYENCTYFVSSGTVDAGECRLRVCQCSDNICQLRLDFDTFVLNQPDTCNFKTVSHYHVLIWKIIALTSFFLATTSVAKIGGKSVYEKGQCQTDIFSVTAPGNNAPPVICGTNTGEHSK